MNFETIDWEMEAERVKRAFGLDGECWFVLVDTNSECRELIQRNQSPFTGIVLEGREKIYLRCYFTKEAGRSFTIYPEAELLNEVGTHIQIRWDGTIHRDTIHNAYSDILAKGLFFLDLLTPEIEATLEPGNSAHEKLEWAFEKPVRMAAVAGELATYSEMDWEREAQRIKDAFKFVGDCEMIEEEPNTFVIGGFIAGRRSISIDVIYRNQFQIFVVDGWEAENSAWLTILPDGKARYSSMTCYDDRMILAKGLYYLGLLNDEVCSAFDALFTTPQKQKWQQEYDERMKAASDSA